MTIEELAKAVGEGQLNKLDGQPLLARLERARLAAVIASGCADHDVRTDDLATWALEIADAILEKV